MNLNITIDIPSPISLDWLRSKLPGNTSAATAVATTPEIDAMLRLDCVVAIGVSGGKDSDACALAVCAHLDKIGHIGPRVLIHADLGVVEWKDSAPSCERLAAHLGLELMTVNRKAGDMMDRWEREEEEAFLAEHAAPKRLISLELH